MANGTHPSWPPRNISDLVFSNCTVASHWYIGYLKTGDLPAVATATIISDGFSALPNNSNITQPSYGEIVDWFMDLEEPNRNTLLSNVHNFTFSKCQEEACPRIGWEGDADIMGSGILASYFVQAALTTVYIYILALRDSDFRTIRSYVNRTRLSRLRSAIEYSTRTFLDASILVCIATHVAAIYILSRGYINKSSQLTHYSAGMATWVSLHTIISPFMLQVVVSHNLRRLRWRAFTWILIAILATIVIVLGRNNPVADTHALESFSVLSGLEDQLLWETWCMPGTYVQGYLTTSDFVIGSLAVSFIPWLLWELTPRKARSDLRLWARGTRFPSRSTGNFLRLFYLVIMWMNLILLVSTRANFNHNSGAFNKDYQWTFGQILALATWAPVFVELIYIWIQGPEKALTGQLLKPYEVVAAVEMTSGQADQDDPTRVGAEPVSEAQSLTPCEANGQNVELQSLSKQEDEARQVEM